MVQHYVEPYILFFPTYLTVYSSTCKLDCNLGIWGCVCVYMWLDRISSTIEDYINQQTFLSKTLKRFEYYKLVFPDNYHVCKFTAIL